MNPWLAFPFLFGSLYLFARGLRTSSLSGFHFYWVAGLVRRLGFFWMALGWWLYQEPDGWVWRFWPFILFAIGELWESGLEIRAQSNNAAKWRAWKRLKNKTKWWQKLLLLPGIEKRERF